MCISRRFEDAVYTDGDYAYNYPSDIGARVHCLHPGWLRMTAQYGYDVAHFLGRRKEALMYLSSKMWDYDIAYRVVVWTASFAKNAELQDIAQNALIGLRRG